MQLLALPRKHEFKKSIKRGGGSTKKGEDGRKTSDIEKREERKRSK